MRVPYIGVMPPIPPPRTDGYTTTTPVPLYWAAYGPEGAPQLLVLHGGPGAHHDYLLPQMLPEIRARFPRLQLELREAVTSTLIEETAARLWNVLNEGKPFTLVFGAALLVVTGAPAVGLLACARAWCATSRRRRW